MRQAVSGIHGAGSRRDLGATRSGAFGNVEAVEVGEELFGETTVIAGIAGDIGRGDISCNGQAILAKIS
jgi:hypothetical protein